MKFGLNTILKSAGSVLLALTLTVKQYYRQLCIYALHFVENAGAAEDIVQDAFVGLWQRRDDIRDVKPYLYASVRNGCLTFLKKQRQSTEGLSDGMLEDLPDEGLEDRSEIEARMWSAIDSLPERRRQVLLMSKRDGMNYFRDVNIEAEGHLRPHCPQPYLQGSGRPPEPAIEGFLIFLLHRIVLFPYCRVLMVKTLLYACEKQ